ncbi:MFS transporter [Candidatus Bathyarchaeota archaeon]|nr:MAG: MFS transporter [Candidatus Bathyarchaeota archaeon]
MAHKLDPTGSLVGLAISSWFLTRIFIEVPSGLISAKVGRRNLIVRGILLGILGSLLCALSNSIYILILGRTLWGFGTALYFTSNTALMLDLFNPEVRGRAMGVFQGICFLGSFLGAPLGAVLARFIGFNAVFVAATVVVLPAFLVAFFSKDLREMDRAARREHETVPIRNIITSLNDPALLGVCYVNLSRMLVAQGVMSTVFQLYLNETLGIAVELIGLTLAVRTISIISMVVLSGYLTDRLGSELVVLLGLAINALGQGLYPLASSFEQILPLAIIESAGGGFLFTSLIVYLSDLVSPSLRGGAVGLFRTFMDLGGILGPIVFMLIYNSLGPHTSFWLASAMLTSNIVIISLIKMRRRVDNLSEFK